MPGIIQNSRFKKNQFREYFFSLRQSSNPTVMSIPDQRYIKVQYAITLGAALFLMIVTAVNHTPPMFDEILFYRNMPLFREYGLSAKFLLEMPDQAPGPLYQIIHTLFTPLTGFTTPGIRLVNVFLFFLVIGLTHLILKHYVKGLQHELLLALNLVAVPVIWQVAGMALTEMPGMFFAMLSLLILGALVRRGRETNLVTLGLGLAGGICLGIAILGRTHFIVMMPAAAILVFNPLAAREQWQTVSIWAMMLYLVAALAICTPMFYIWQGFLPPHQAVISQGSLKPWHAVLAFAYAGIIVVLLVPQWFKMNKRIALGLVALTLIYFVCNLFWWKKEYMPLYYFLAGIFPTGVMKIYPYLSTVVLMVFATYFVVHVVYYAFQHKNNAYYLVIAACLVLALATCINVKHLFSSRYVAQASPFLILLIAEKDGFDKFKILRLLIGIGMGYASLHTYLDPLNNIH